MAALIRKTDKCCYNCVWAEWRRDRLGRRQPMYAGKCTKALPKVPISCWPSYVQKEKRRLERHSIHAEMGEDCETFCHIDNVVK